MSNTTISTLTNKELAAQAREAAQHSNGRIRNWESPKPSASIVEKGRYQEINHGRYSRGCKYNRYTYAPLYSSSVEEKEGKLVYSFGFAGQIKTISKPIPAGMKYTQDRLGAKLVRVSDGMDHHFTGDELVSRDFASRVRKSFAFKYKQIVAARAEKRKQDKNKKEAVRLEKLFQRDLKHTYVNLNDSMSAGNCVEGSLRFAELRLKMNREEIIRGGHLCVVNAARLVETRDERVIRAAKRAWVRETLVAI